MRMSPTTLFDGAVEPSEADTLCGEYLKHIYRGGDQEHGESALQLCRLGPRDGDAGAGSWPDPCGGVALPLARWWSPYSRRPDWDETPEDVLDAETIDAAGDGETFMYSLRLKDALGVRGGRNGLLPEAESRGDDRLGFCWPAARAGGSRCGDVWSSGVGGVTVGNIGTPE